MGDSNRPILPKGEGVGGMPGLSRQTQSAPGELGGSSGKQKRKLTLSACEPCRKRKTKCDGQRPTCSACLHKATDECIWEVKDASLSRMAALKNKIDELEQRLQEQTASSKPTKDLMGYLMTRPEREAHNVLQRLRSTQNIPATVQYVRDGDLLISSVVLPEPQADGIGYRPKQ